MANTPPIILTDARYLDEQTAEFLAQAKKNRTDKNFMQ